MGACLELIRLDIIDRQQKLDALLLGELEQFLGQMDLILFHSAGSGGNTECAIKRIRHRTPNQKDVGLLHQRLDNAKFVRNLRSAQDYQKWPARISQLTLE